VTPSAPPAPKTRRETGLLFLGCNYPEMPDGSPPFVANLAHRLAWYPLSASAAFSPRDAPQCFREAPLPKAPHVRRVPAPHPVRIIIMPAPAHFIAVPGTCAPMSPVSPNGENSGCQ
jgi:hypothetical protein